jgi:hypothetical protein
MERTHGIPERAVKPNFSHIMGSTLSKTLESQTHDSLKPSDETSGVVDTLRCNIER